MLHTDIHLPIDEDTAAATITEVFLHGVIGGSSV